MDDSERRQIARKRLVSVLGSHGIAGARTLEQKISDAGPFPQRIDPHVLTAVRNELVTESVLNKKTFNGQNWFYLASRQFETLQQRFSVQQEVLIRLENHNFGLRRGQTLEIAFLRAMKQQEKIDYIGDFSDLEIHDDSKLYSKDGELGAFSGKRLPGKMRLDFLLFDKNAGLAGVEIKNVREWFYPQRTEIQQFLLKCTSLDAVPILIARRIPFVTFKLMRSIGVIVHQTYNQLYPAADNELAASAKDKMLLGYHDIRLGNQPDSRLLHFVNNNLPQLLPEARERFAKFKDLTKNYGRGEIKYKSLRREFVADLKVSMKTLMTRQR